jgi:hypothetical protein
VHRLTGVLSCRSHHFANRSCASLHGILNPFHLAIDTIGARRTPNFRGANAAVNLSYLDPDETRVSAARNFTMFHSKSRRGFMEISVMAPRRTTALRAQESQAAAGELPRDNSTGHMTCRLLCYSLVCCSVTLYALLLCGYRAECRNGRVSFVYRILSSHLS